MTLWIASRKKSAGESPISKTHYIKRSNVLLELRTFDFGLSMSDLADEAIDWGYDCEHHATDENADDDKHDWFQKCG